QAVNLPSECDVNAKPVPYPPIRKDDLGVTAARYVAALGQANGRLAAVAEGKGKGRGLFAGGAAKRCSTRHGLVLALMLLLCWVGQLGVSARSNRRSPMKLAITRSKLPPLSSRWRAA